MWHISGWQNLTEIERVEKLRTLGDATGRTDFALEKDIWVVDVLRCLFESEFKEFLQFKGGTSLSKGFQIIDRFSEDIDIAWNMENLLGRKIDYQNREFMSKNGYKAERRIEEIIDETLLPLLKNVYQECEVSSEKKIISIDYPFSADGITKASARIKIEFETRSSAAPSMQVPIAPYAAALPGFILWDNFNVPCMPPEITFWEKITAIYRLTTLQNLEWQLGRHWFDVVQIWEKVGRERILDKSVVEAVVGQSHTRGKDNLDYLAILDGKLVLTYDPITESKALIAAIEETITRGYFQNAPDIEELIEALGLLESILNDFLLSNVISKS